jgi:hypothetical protein
MATVTQFWSRSAPFQAVGPAVVWAWELGDGQYYWAFAVRPAQANATVTVGAITASSDNTLHHTTLIPVTVGSAGRGSAGCLLQFTAIKVTTP